jgi:hypothetical protein
MLRRLGLVGQSAVQDISFLDLRSILASLSSLPFKPGDQIN